MICCKTSLNEKDFNFLRRFAYVRRFAYICRFAYNRR